VCYSGVRVQETYSTIEEEELFFSGFLVLISGRREAMNLFVDVDSGTDGWMDE